VPRNQGLWSVFQLYLMALNFLREGMPQLSGKAASVLPIEGPVKEFSVFENGNGNDTRP
jgi:hypothetical protein